MKGGAASQKSFESRKEAKNQLQENLWKNIYSKRSSFHSHNYLYLFSLFYLDH